MLIDARHTHSKNEDILTKGTESPPSLLEAEYDTPSHSRSSAVERSPGSNSSPYHLRTHNTHTHHGNPDTHQTHQTQLCRHWCHHGICKWGQQCRYKHIMPMTLSGLHEIGLIDWPAWYRSLNPGYFSHSHHLETKNEMNNNTNNNNNQIVRRTGINAAGGVGGGKIPGTTCCGGAHGEVKYIDGRPGSRSGPGPIRARDKLRTGNKYVVRSRSTGRILKADELGDQIIARLRGMEKSKEKEKEKENEKG